MRKYLTSIITILSLLFTACSQTADELATDNNGKDANTIHIGGVTADDQLTVETRTSYKAEDIDWLKPALQTGIDVTYYLASNTTDTRTATLKLAEDESSETSTDSTKYTFKIKSTGDDACWLGNGGHMFHGFHIPTALTTATSETTPFADQSNETNYTNLEHYLCMPANHQIQATISYVRLPFRHRLARVIAYVLIDPTLSTTLKKISFDNVKILSHVDGTTPQWTTARQITPHSMGQHGSMDRNMNEINTDFLAYYNEKNDEYIYPTNDGWSTAKAAGYTETNYGKVPVYDVIVRPTYTKDELVVYDEATGTTASQKNSIDFVVNLENGLEYTKTFEFDLDANYQTVVYLRISREKVDYETMGASLWQTTTGNDGPYGLDNESDQRLSIAGGSWQRAYRTASAPTDNVTDGSEYSQQYISQSDWMNYFTQATVGGEHWGDYFILDSDITIDVSSLPDDFVFAGHLDGRGHTITLTGTRSGKDEVYLFDGLNGTYDAQAGQANVHSETRNGTTQLVPLKGYRGELLNLRIVGGSLFKTMTAEEQAQTVTGYIYNCK